MVLCKKGDDITPYDGTAQEMQRLSLWYAPAQHKDMCKRMRMRSNVIILSEGHVCALRSLMWQVSKLTAPSAALELWRIWYGQAQNIASCPEVCACAVLIFNFHKGCTCALRKLTAPDAALEL
jgi:hypothetical protein